MLGACLAVPGRGRAQSLSWVGGQGRFQMPLLRELLLQMRPEVKCGGLREAWGSGQAGVGPSLLLRARVSGSPETV